MNLSFTTVSTADGFSLQRADVTDNRDFWIAWKKANHALKSKVTLRREPDGWMCYRQVRTDNFTSVPFTCPYTLRSTDKLLPFQPPAVAHLCASLLAHNGAADGSDTGIGKTFVALKTCIELNLKPAVICKKSGVAGWTRACRYMGVQPYFITNWEAVRTGKFPFCRRSRNEWSGKYLYQWSLPPGTCLIFDEAHSGCNDGTQNNAMFTAARGVPLLALSATFADRPARMKALFDVLGIMDPERFNGWLESRGNFENQHGQIESLSAVEDMKWISRELYPVYGYRLSYNDPEVKRFFPDGVYQTQIVSMSDEDTMRQNALYNELLVKVEHYRELKRQADILVADLRYRQETELLKCNPLSELIEEYLYEGYSVAVFVNFRETLAWLAKFFKTKSLIFGAQERYKISRDQVIEDFQANRTRIVLAMVDAGGVSLDLHDLHGDHPRMSLICPTYNPITLKQVMGRTRRAGSKTTPIIKLIYTAGTVEEKVAETVNAKLDNISALNDGDMMEPDLWNLGIKRE